MSKLTCVVGHLRASEGGEWLQKQQQQKKYKKKSEINCGFESQVKIKRSQIHREMEREREREREREINWREKPDYGGLSLAVFSERQTKADSWSQQWEPPESQRWSVWSLLTDWCVFRSFNPSGFKQVSDKLSAFFSLCFYCETLEKVTSLFGPIRHMQTVQCHNDLPFGIVF